MSQLDPAHSYKKPKIEVVCCYCEEQPAAKRCKQCQIPFCDSCNAHVHAKGAFKAHVVVPVDFRDENTPDTQRFVFLCSEHKGKQLEFYCSQDSTLVCAHCLHVGSHKGHTHLSPCDAFNQLKPYVKKQIEEIEAHLSSLITKSGDTAKKIQEALTKRAAIKASIDVEKARIISILNAKAAEADALMDAHIRELEGSSERLQASVHHAKKSIQSLRVIQEEDDHMLFLAAFTTNTRLNAQFTEDNNNSCCDGFALNSASIAQLEQHAQSLQFVVKEAQLQPQPQPQPQPQFPPLLTVVWDDSAKGPEITLSDIRLVATDGGEGLGQSVRATIPFRFRCCNNNNNTSAAAPKKQQYHCNVVIRRIRHMFWVGIVDKNVRMNARMADQKGCYCIGFFRGHLYKFSNGTASGNLDKQFAVTDGNVLGLLLEEEEDTTQKTATLSFTLNGKPIPLATFRGIPITDSECYYPAVSLRARSSAELQFDQMIA